MTPVSFTEDAASRRWLAARVMRGPLVVLEFGSPVLVIAALAVIVNLENLAARPLALLVALALPFGVPVFLAAIYPLVSASGLLELAAIYPLVRWRPQAWTLDERGITGRGRAAGTCPWDAIARWSIVPAGRLPGVFLVVFRRAPTWRSFSASMLVPAGDRAAVEAWLKSRAGAAEHRSP